ncbi:MAG: hypothetical protein KGY67_07600 [Candidatus Thermoplasmatota archaeon]|nr:hypothetical protein [Candidatus Thermoplasmatota archaeon]
MNLFVRFAGVENRVFNQRLLIMINMIIFPIILTNHRGIMAIFGKTIKTDERVSRM